MKTLSPKQIFEMKKAGSKFTEIERPAKKPAGSPPKKAQGVERSFETLNQYVKQIVTKKDNTLIMMQSADVISRTLLKAVDKIERLQNQEQIKAWNINVTRGADKLIKTLTMKAG